VEGLNQMGADTPHISVEEASHKLAEILEGSKGNEDNLVCTTEKYNRPHIQNGIHSHYFSGP